MVVNRVMTERVRSQMQVFKLRFLGKSKVLRCLTKFVTLRLENFSTSSRYFSGLKDLSLDSKQNASGTASKQTLYAEVSAKRPVGSPRTSWLDYIEDLGWNRLALNPSEIQSVLVNREKWRLNLEPLSPQTSSKSGSRKNKRFIIQKMTMVSCTTDTLNSLGFSLQQR